MQEKGCKMSVNVNYLQIRKLPAVKESQEDFGTNIKHKTKTTSTQQNATNTILMLF